MTYKHILLVAALSGLATSASLAQEPAPAPEAGQARALMAQGDNWLGANLLRRAVAKDDSPENRFNLATGYLRTNRLTEARRIYQDLAIEGQTVVMAADPAPRTGLGAGRTFDIAEESASRLLYIGWREGQTRAPATIAAGGARSADLAGVAVSAKVAGEVTDDRARQLDAMVRQGQD